MIHLFAFTTGVFGIAYCAGTAKVSLPFRHWLSTRSMWLVNLLECPACLSFWLGAGAVVIGVSPRVFGDGVPAAVFCAFYCCASSLVLAKISGLDEE